MKRKGKPSVAVLITSIVMASPFMYVLSIGPATWLASGPLRLSNASPVYRMIDGSYRPLWQLAKVTKAEKALIVYQDLWFPLKDGPISHPTLVISGDIRWNRPFRK